MKTLARVLGRNVFLPGTESNPVEPWLKMTIGKGPSPSGLYSVASSFRGCSPTARNGSLVGIQTCTPCADAAPNKTKDATMPMTRANELLMRSPLNPPDDQPSCDAELSVSEQDAAWITSILATI